MLFGRLRLSAKAMAGVIAFTAVEVVTLTGWIATLDRQILSVVILSVGLLIEHIIATQVGKDPE